jgi:hypothetical protein
MIDGQGLAPRGLRGMRGIAAAVCGAAAQAHHSFAMYDQTKQEAYTGKLVRFIPGANHAQLLFEIVGPDGKLQSGADGKPITWGVEPLPPRRLPSRA